MIKLRITLFFYFLGLIFLPCKAIVTNQYEVHLQYSKTTVVDTSYCRFQSYFAERKKQIIDVEKKYDSTSYRLNKDILTLIDFINRSDTTITLKFYSTLYKYTNVGETDEIIDDKISIKKSALIKSNKQFFEVTILPKTTLHTYLLYKPISFKDYYENENALFRYTNKYLFPEFDKNTYKENIGYSILMLLLLGMVFILFIFYGLAYINLRDRIYLSYAIYLSITFFQVLYMAQYIFSKNFVMFNYIGHSGFDEATKGLMIVFYSIFYRQAFNITSKSKVLYISVEALKIISILYVSIISISYLFTISFYFEPYVYFWYRFPIFFFSLVVLIYSFRIKNLTGFQKIILVGSLIYTVFTAFTTMQKIDYPIKDLMVSINGLCLGIMLELIIFSIALGVRIRDSFMASEKLKDKLIVELQQNEEFITNENIILEEKVKERVYEIKQQNLLIEEQQKQALIQSFEKEKVEIQMQALSAQMNPHFIFNCMNSIQHSIVTNNTEKASVMLHDFASLIRMVLENSSQPDITLENEIKLLETYLKLEQIRTNNSFDYKIDVDSSMSADFIKIPTMMLQPFLENAIWHGFKLINYKGKIQVAFSLLENSVACNIIDNGIGRKKANQIKHQDVKKSMAIQIIQNRISLLNRTLTNNSASLEIVDLFDDQQTPQGTKVSIILPIL
jgi:sensor histidine kinase YesM